MASALKQQDNPNILIYRHHLLRPSETFIREQASALQNFTPFYVGARAVPGLSIPKDRTFVVNPGTSVGKIWEFGTRPFGFPPSFAWKLKALNASLIHAHFAQDATAALPLAKALNIPLVATFHGYDVTVQDDCAEKTWIQKQYFARRETLKTSAKLFIAVSDFIRRNAIAQGFPEERIVVHYIGVDSQRFQAVPNLDRQPVVLFVGRLVEKKGCEYLLQAMEQIQSQIPEMEVVVIGEGPERQKLETYAKQHLKHYRFLGAQPPEQVQYWMQQAQVFCVPSITADSGDAEGFGIVFAEAQATGLPVVSFASGGIPEAVAHEQTGFLAPERDVEALATYLKTLLTNPTLWTQFSHRGRERVLKEFNLAQQTRLLEEIYWERVIESPELYPQQLRFSQP
jgi:colanic acid/amylovoran biosynthesis glycosyltransferase